VVLPPPKVTSRPRAAWVAWSALFSLVFVSGALVTFVPFPLSLLAAAAVAALPLVGGEWVKGTQRAAPRFVEPGGLVFEGRGYILAGVTGLYWSFGSVLLFMATGYPGSWWGGLLAALLLCPGCALPGALRNSAFIRSGERLTFLLRGRLEWEVPWSEVVAVEHVRRIIVVGRGSRIPYWCVDLVHVSGETYTVSGLRLPETVIQSITKRLEIEVARRPGIRWGHA
jgi:hypothetical protein